MNSRIKELISPLPGFTILHARAEEDALTPILSSMLQEAGGTLNLAIYEPKNEAEEFDDNVKVQYVENYDKVFRALPRDNDIVILQDVLAKHSDKERMLKNAYMTLANAAQIIIMEKKGVMDIDEVKSWLYEREFRAANEIEIIDGYDLIMAKKMHMWGNGL
ncbi:hypothetical protein [Sulfurimonas sp. HSL-1716]|uniref:hypothetical protein n=1 Tax=Hydrocurvibacter sulfurireducens TaxID=3131937 RepID=UPI0031F854B9